MSLPAGPLYAFALPDELLQSLVLRTIHQAVPIEEATHDEPVSQEATTSLGCSACSVLAFASVADQRRHFRSDWHRYNAKLRTAGKSGIPEDQFDGLIDSQSLSCCSMTGLR